MTVIEQIKAEIERRKKEMVDKGDQKPFYDAEIIRSTAISLYTNLLSFLDTLESEKPMNQEDLEEEIETWISAHISRTTDEILPLNPIELADVCKEWGKGIARHFAKWGAKHAKIESEKPVPADLEEAAEISFDEAYALTEDYRDFLAKGLTENQPRPIGPHWFCEYAKNRFIAGAKWQAEQDQETIELAEDHAYLAGAVNEREKMMKEAVEVTLDNTACPTKLWFNTYLSEYSNNDKVRIIIVKK